MKYRMTVSLLNRWRTPGKRADGHRLSWRRNANGTLTAWQRMTVDGIDRDIKVETVAGDLDKAQLDAIREKGRTLKDGPSTTATTDMTLAEAWGAFHEAITTTNNSRWSTDTAEKAAARVANHVRPTKLWTMPVTTITPAHIYDELLPLRLEKPATEEKTRQVLSKVFAYLLGRRLVAGNPVRSVADIASNLAKATAAKHFAALTALDELGELLRANDRSDAIFDVRAATLLQALTAQRTANIVAARWECIDLERKTWTIPRAEMKVTGLPYDHAVPLSPPAVELLTRVGQKESGYVFASGRSTAGHITANTLPKHLKRTLGYGDRHVPHGWRSAFRSIAADQVVDGRPRFDRQWLESVLDHKMGDTTAESAYIRSQCLEGARHALDWWGKALTEAAR